jgi:hypothetical protein
MTGMTKRREEGGRGVKVVEVEGERMGGREIEGKVRERRGGKEGGKRQNLGVEGTTQAGREVGNKVW